MVLFRRFFYRKPPDRLLEFSERVYGLTDVIQGRNADALALYFNEDPAKCPSEQLIFVVTLLNFVRMFWKAHDENVKQAGLEKKKVEKEAEMEKAKGINLTKKSSMISEGVTE